MRIAKDMLAHLKWASAAALALALTIALSRASAPLAIAAAGALFVWAVERYQAVRGEGTASKADMLAGWAPFLAVAAAWWAVGP